jgi:hypothetical protein
MTPLINKNTSPTGPKRFFSLPDQTARATRNNKEKPEAALIKDLGRLFLEAGRVREGAGGSRIDPGSNRRSSNIDDFRPGSGVDPTPPSSP